MKNIVFCLSLMMLVSGCADQLEEKFYNPENSTDPSIPGFFTRMLNNDRVRPNYWNVRTFLLLQPAVYSQTAFYTNSSEKYQQTPSYTQQYWNNFYVNNANGSGVLSHYRAMETVYAGLNDAAKAEMDIFMNAAKLILIDEASKMVDLWGDIPYSQAGSLQSSGVIVNAPFDDQVTLYSQFISDLQTIATFFGTAVSTTTFAKYDILLSGNTAQWQRYANSLRLRLLMRISNVDEATAQTEVTAMLANSATFPLIDGNSDGNYSPAASDILLEPLTTYIDNLNAALTELPSHPAPDYMLNTAMLPANDPRIPVMFDKFGATVDGVFVPNQNYGAVSVTLPAEEQLSNFPLFSILDSATFLQNRALPGIAITAPEVNFLKAEAFERWGGGDAAAAYETAVKQSVTFYYYLNNLNASGLVTLPKPPDATINELLANPNIAYTGSSGEKLAKIWTQKWLNFGFLQSTQAWAEYRRTGYPQLNFPPSTLPGYQNPPLRLLYPADEITYNRENYEAVQSKDTRDTKIFWDP